MTGICCPGSLWLCIACSQLTCGVHDPSPGEVRGICERCIPLDPKEDR